MNFEFGKKYEGTSGQGKSLFLVHQMMDQLHRGAVITTNMEMDIESVRKYLRALGDMPKPCVLRLVKTPEDV